MTWLFVMMRLPSITTPLPEDSSGWLRRQGWVRLGSRLVVKIFTSDLRTTPSSEGAFLAGSGLRGGRWLGLGERDVGEGGDGEDEAGEEPGS